MIALLLSKPKNERQYVQIQCKNPNCKPLPETFYDYVPGCHVWSYSVLQVTFIVLCGYLAHSLPAGSRKAPPSRTKCLATMKSQYAKQIKAHAANAAQSAHNFNYTHPDTEEEYPVDTESPLNCPLERPTGEEDMLSDRALCPWYSIRNHDEFRYPQDLLEVKCRCQECIKVNEGVCERVYYNVPVLRYDTSKEKGNCASRIKWTLRPISVGCTCARKPSHF